MKTMEKKQVNIPSSPGKPPDDDDDEVIPPGFDFIN
ncbi:Uncharacterised protein [Yersinia frederiksenii]|nr:Uncharacterised protein [Yersinia frederiksenii]